MTAFYAECPSRNMCLNASIWTKSNFSGMSVGVTMVGEVTLNLGDFGERYDFTMPSAYARSIISVPWIELGGKVVINCPNTGYSAHIIFHTKVCKCLTKPTLILPAPYCYLYQFTNFVFEYLAAFLWW